MLSLSTESLLTLPLQPEISPSSRAEPPEGFQRHLDARRGSQSPEAREPKVTEPNKAAPSASASTPPASNDTPAPPRDASAGAEPDSQSEENAPIAVESKKPQSDVTYSDDEAVDDEATLDDRAETALLVVPVAVTVEPIAAVEVPESSETVAKEVAVALHGIPRPKAIRSANTPDSPSAVGEAATLDAAQASAQTPSTEIGDAASDSGGTTAARVVANVGSDESGSASRRSATKALTSAASVNSDGKAIASGQGLTPKPSPAKLPGDVSTNPATPAKSIAVPVTPTREPAITSSRGARREARPKQAARTGVTDPAIDATSSQPTGVSAPAGAANSGVLIDSLSIDAQVAAPDHNAATAPRDAADVPQPRVESTPQVPRDGATQARGIENNSLWSGRAEPSPSGLNEWERVRLVQRVARAIRSADVDGDGGTIRIRLSPPDLGSLRIELAVRSGVLTARLEAEHSHTRSLLLDNLPALRERLAEQQIRVDRFDVDLMGRHGSDGRQPWADGDAPQPGQRRLRVPRVAKAAQAAEAVPRASRPRLGPGQFNAVV